MTNNSILDERFPPKLIESMLAEKKYTWFQKNLWSFFLLAAILLLIIVPLFQKGTFIDGMLYKTVAYNYSIGESSFWNMKFTNTSMTFFCEQPPIYFFVLGNFYKLFGTHYLADRFFTLLLFIAFIFILKLIFKLLFPNKNGPFLLAIFMLVSIAVFCWSYANQVIEPLLCFITAFAIYFFIKFIISKNHFYSLLFCIAVFLLFLTKGFQSCFVIILPLTYLMLSKWNKTIFKFCLLFGFLLSFILAFTLFVYQPAVNWFNAYYQARLVLTFNNVGNTTDSHLEIIVRFFTELIVCLMCLLFLSVWLSTKKKYPIKFMFRNFSSNKLAVSLLITSLAGSFPYALSLVQRGFYLLPAFVCFVLAIIIGFHRYWKFFYAPLLKVSENKFVQTAVLLIVIASFTISSLTVNNYKRDEPLIKDVDLILTKLNKNDTLLVNGDLWNYFSLHAYLYINKQVNLSTEKKDAHFIISNKNENLPPQDSGYKLITSNTNELVLYENEKFVK